MWVNCPCTCVRMWGTCTPASKSHTHAWTKVTPLNTCKSCPQFSPSIRMFMFCLCLCHTLGTHLSLEVAVAIHGQYSVHASTAQIMNSISYLLISCTQAGHEYGIQPHPPLGQAQCSYRFHKTFRSFVRLLQSMCAVTRAGLSNLRSSQNCKRDLIAPKHLPALKCICQWSSTSCLQALFNRQLQLG